MWTYSIIDPSSIKNMTHEKHPLQIADNFRNYWISSSYVRQCTVHTYVYGVLFLKVLLQHRGKGLSPWYFGYELSLPDVKGLWMLDSNGPNFRTMQSSPLVWIQPNMWERRWNYVEEHHSGILEQLSLFLPNPLINLDINQIYWHPWNNH